MERTGTLHSASPPKHRRVSAGLRPPAGASACSEWGQRRLAEASINLLLLPPGARRMPLQAGLGNPTAGGANQYVPSGRNRSDLTDLQKKNLFLLLNLKQ